MAAMASQMAALNASFAGAKVTKAAKKVRVSARAMKPVRAAVAAPCRRVRGHRPGLRQHHSLPRD